MTHARANRPTPTPPGAQPDVEMSTDPVMGGGGLAPSIQRPSASAPAQRHHESTTKLLVVAGKIAKLKGAARVIGSSQPRNMRAFWMPCSRTSSATFGSDTARDTCSVPTAIV